MCIRINKLYMKLTYSKIIFLVICFCVLKGTPSHLIRAARSQIGKTVSYTPDYQKISYPMGDIPLSQGVCTDVIIRALRDAYGIDLQQLIHKDNHCHPYPRISKPDPCIDHRRVPNMVTFFQRNRLETQDGIHKPGDIVVWKVGELLHIGLVSEPTAGTQPLVIHNIDNRGVQEEDFFSYNYPILHHFRLSEDFIRQFGKTTAK